MRSGLLDMRKRTRRGIGILPNPIGRSLSANIGSKRIDAIDFLEPRQRLEHRENVMLLQHPRRSRAAQRKPLSLRALSKATISLQV